MIDLLKNLIEIESLSGSEDCLVDYLHDWVLTRKLPVQRTGNNLVVDFKGTAWSEKNRTILLCSHIDTVPPCKGWVRDPYKATVEGDRIYGLGANDALASVVSMLFGLIDARDSIKHTRVLLAIVCEEEKGANGFVKIEPSLPRYDYGIFGEPTNLRIGYCMRGSMKIKMITSGRSCHASRPHEGENAAFNLIRDLTSIRDLPLTDASPWGGATVVPTVIRGGEAENQVPDLIETILDIRPTFDIDNDRIISLLTSTGLSFEVLRNIRRPMMCDQNSHLVKTILECSPGAELYAFGGSCDMAFATAPSVVLGPGASERSHAPDEFIAVSEISGARELFGNILKSV